MTNKCQEIFTMSRLRPVSNIIPSKEPGFCEERADSKSEAGNKQDDDKPCGTNKQRIYQKKGAGLCHKDLI